MRPGSPGARSSTPGSIRMKKLMAKLCHSTERRLVTFTSRGTPWTSNEIVEPENSGVTCVMRGGRFGTDTTAYAVGPCEIATDSSVSRGTSMLMNKT